MSEWGPLQVQGDAMDLALYMARRIVEFVNILKVSAFAYWQVSGSGRLGIGCCSIVLSRCVFEVPLPQVFVLANLQVSGQNDRE